MHTNRQSIYLSLSICFAKKCVICNVTKLVKVMVLWLKCALQGIKMLYTKITRKLSSCLCCSYWLMERVHVDDNSDVDDK